ncbi:hypothetical protein CEXT_532441 [Caerostris extrusa]|uniref:Uncharacterized protein n=1 Tax=Caerostris extrusa TaxID=172846 RepID=A0AAV4MS44_CAEEX|nr:hypothetical protein CEXT_532441 [Caerostris extrusa]
METQHSISRLVPLNSENSIKSWENNISHCHQSSTNQEIDQSNEAIVPHAPFECPVEITDCDNLSNCSVDSNNSVKMRIKEKLDITVCDEDLD